MVRRNAMRLRDSQEVGSRQRQTFVERGELDRSSLFRTVSLIRQSTRVFIWPFLHRGERERNAEAAIAVLVPLEEEATLAQHIDDDLADRCEFASIFPLPVPGPQFS